MQITKTLIPGPSNNSPKYMATERVPGFPGFVSGFGVSRSEAIAICGIKAEARISLFNRRQESVETRLPVVCACC